MQKRRRAAAFLSQGLALSDQACKRWGEPQTDGPTQSLAEQRKRPEWWEYCASDRDLMLGREHWNAGPDAPDPTPWQADGARWECAKCGQPLSRPDFLCRQCKRELGRLYRADLCRELALLRLEDAPKTRRILTRKGLQATPAELASGDLELYQRSAWPEPVRAIVAIEERRRQVGQDRNAAGVSLESLDDGASDAENDTERLAISGPGESPIELAVASLRPEEQAVAAYRAQGLTHAEIAELLGVTPGAARKRWRRVAAKLREELGET